MKTAIVRLGLSLLAAVGIGAAPAFAQYAVPSVPPIVAPAIPYQPAQPKPPQGGPLDPGNLPAVIQGLGFNIPGDTRPTSNVIPATYFGVPDARPTPNVIPASYVQPNPAEVNQIPALEYPIEGAPAVEFSPNNSIPPPRIWVRGEYLLWWVKDAPVPVPLVTTGNPVVGFPATNTAGALGAPGTQILLGGSSVGYDVFSGMRFALGGYLDNDRTVGLEVSAFMLELRPFNYSIQSNSAGNPPLYLPRSNPSAGIEDAVPIADPLRGYAGGATFYSTLQIWGAEANFSFNLYRQPGCEFTILAGFRYASLSETLQFNTTTNDLATMNTITTADNFSTDNNFYGGQIGAQVLLERYGFSLDITGKVAFGTTQQVVDIQGNSSQLGPNPLVPPGLGTFPGGYYAQPSNIGRRDGSSYSVIPSLEMNLSYQITNELRLFVGYTFMYWTNVVRPGDQMSHDINGTQNPLLSATGGSTLVGPAVPAPLFNRSDFFAHGLNFGLEFRF